MNRDEDMRVHDSEYLIRLAKSYERNADELTEHRDRLIDRRSTAKLPPEELNLIGARIDILYAEISDLRKTALHLRRLAAPLTMSPSLARRERNAS